MTALDKYIAGLTPDAVIDDTDLFWKDPSSGPSEYITGAQLKAHFATAAQGALATTAVQPNGSISGNAGTVTTNANLTGPVTSVGNATAIANGALAIAKLANGTDGELITWDASGVIATIAVGTLGQVLTGQGVGAPPIFMSTAITGTYINANYTAAAGENIYADTSGGAITIELPASPIVNTIVKMQDAVGWAYTNPITVDRNGQTINGEAVDFTLECDKGLVEFIFDGTTWIPSGLRVIVGESALAASGNWHVCYLGVGASTTWLTVDEMMAYIHNNTFNNVTLFVNVYPGTYDVEPIASGTEYWKFTNSTGINEFRFDATQANTCIFDIKDYYAWQVIGASVTFNNCEFVSTVGDGGYPFVVFNGSLSVSGATIENFANFIDASNSYIELLTCEFQNTAADGWTTIFLRNGSYGSILECDFLDDDAVSTAVYLYAGSRALIEGGSFEGCAEGIFVEENSQVYLQAVDVPTFTSNTSDYNLPLNQMQGDGSFISDGNLNAAKSPATTVAALPSATTVGAGARSFVTDANATTFLSTVAAGGANKVPVVSDGTNWLIG